MFLFIKFTKCVKCVIDNCNLANIIDRWESSCINCTHENSNTQYAIIITIIHAQHVDYPRFTYKLRISIWIKKKNWNIWVLYTKHLHYSLTSAATIKKNCKLSKHDMNSPT